MKYLLILCLLAATITTILVMKAQAASCYVGGSPTTALIQLAYCGGNYSNENVTLKADYVAKKSLNQSWVVENSLTHQNLCSGFITAQAGQKFSLSCKLVPPEKFAILIFGGEVVDYPNVSLEKDYFFLSPPATPGRPTVEPSSDFNSQSTSKDVYLPLVQ